MFEILTDGFAPSNKRCCYYMALMVSGHPCTWTFVKCGEIASHRFIYVARVPDPSKKGRMATKELRKTLFRCRQHYPTAVTLT
jgi:hypothetical protein